MRIIRFRDREIVHVAVVDGEAIKIAPYDTVRQLLDMSGGSSAWIRNKMRSWEEVHVALDQLNLLVPFELSEVWAAGVTYQRSREARNYEATGEVGNQTTFYDKVYDAKRPEIFFKATPLRTVGPGEAVALRTDSTWQIPEPELGLVMNREGSLIGYTIGNDMSCRDIEGENPLYLPQAKVWKRSCAIGPTLLLADSITDISDFTIHCQITRNSNVLFNDSASLKQLKRTPEELISYLLQDNEIEDFTVLLTGTCVVPDNDFTLQEEDQIDIEITNIGTLSNKVNSHQRTNKELV
ncbi:fumarylacetoacetate hydrolase family protein [Geomicrobium sp. JCM 19055]|uniref:fumarylacetoacetate hydrolase family protein n=1 Tax=Geomicrobium sp. JCM 19055 TaxID=1460649 RepID=UPI00045EDD8C|nr:fumarylacetoacetate hydrolase family protein [Geomicrobium sp. JCM 19055]GAJ99951.1 fumarylacetoacetate hydrolase family protein [Geomicrobium sp. JCM 19055]